MKTRVIIFVICLLGTLTAAAQTKRALVIGLGRYMDSDWEKINGDKDVPYMHLSSDCPTLSCIPSQVQSMEEVAESHPSVCLVQLFKRRAEQTEVKLLVFWSVKLHLAMDLTI